MVNELPNIEITIVHLILIRPLDALTATTQRMSPGIQPLAINQFSGRKLRVINRCSRRDFLSYCHVFMIAVAIKRTQIDQAFAISRNIRIALSLYTVCQIKVSFLSLKKVIV